MNRVRVGGRAIAVVVVLPGPCATGAPHDIPSSDNWTEYEMGPRAGANETPRPRPSRTAPRPAGAALPRAPARPARAAAGETAGTEASSCTSVTTTGSGNSIWNHMPGACGAPVSHRGPGVTAFTAASEFWLAESVHAEVFVSGFGRTAVSSATVQGAFRAVAFRTAATCSGSTNRALLPKLLRT